MVYKGNLLVECQHQQTLHPLVFPTNSLLLQHRDAPVFLLGHLFSYKKYGGKRDIITTSKAPKEKSEEVEGKTIIKIEFLLIKIHNFFSFRNRTRLLWVYSGRGGGQLFFSLVLFSTCQDLVKRESTSMKVFL